MGSRVRLGEIGLEVGVGGGGVGVGAEEFGGGGVFPSGIGGAAEAAKDAAEEEVRLLGGGGEGGCLLEGVDGVLVATERFEGEAELLVGEGVVGAEAYGVFERIERLGGFAFTEKEAAEVEVGLGIGLGEGGLPADGGLVGGDGVGCAPKPFTGEAEVVLGADVAGAEIEGAGEGAGGVGVVVLVVLGAAEEVPEVGVGGVVGGGEEQGAFGVRKIFEQDVIGGDGKKFAGGGCAEAGADVVFGERVGGAVFAEEGVAEEEVSFGGRWVEREEFAKALLGLRKLLKTQMLAGFSELRGGINGSEREGGRRGCGEGGERACRGGSGMAGMTLS